METLTVSASIDIQAPRDEVWSLVADIEKRMRLSPLWDVVKVEKLTPEPFGLDSAFRIDLRRDKKNLTRVTRIIELIPGRSLSHQRADDQNSRVTFSVQDCAVGTRLLYQEILASIDAPDVDALVQSAHQAARAWLNELKQYLEWRGTRTLRLWRAFYDRVLLRVPYTQRHLVTYIIGMHIVSAISFIGAALFWGLAMR